MTRKTAAIKSPWSPQASAPGSIGTDPTMRRARRKRRPRARPRPAPRRLPRRPSAFRGQRGVQILPHHPMDRLVGVATRAGHAGGDARARPGEAGRAQRGARTGAIARRAARFFREADARGRDRGAAREAGGLTKWPYTFGVSPLQQYLARFPGGRLQALPVAWDTRSAAEHGQRWFQLYPDVRDHHDQLHWTGPYQNWNMMCAECHVTGYVKAYDAQKESTPRAGASSASAARPATGRPARTSAWTKSGVAAAGSAHGFARDLRARGKFAMRSHTIASPRAATRPAPTPTPSAPPATRAPAPSTISCARRRARALTQHHRPALLVPPEYWPTGEQHEEVFVWGSFAASKMAGRGVTCGDCHEPHSGAPLARDNSLCTRCHQAEAFDAPAHHHHAQGERRRALRELPHAERALHGHRRAPRPLLPAAAPRSHARDR